MFRRNRRKTRSPRLMQMEQLEDRRLLAADIRWVNRGGDDGFQAAFPFQAEMARRVVDQAIVQWERVFTSFNDPNNDEDVFQLRVVVDWEDPACGASAESPGVGSPWNGIPDEAQINVTTCNAGSGYFFDPTPEDSSEFLGQIRNAFVGRAPGGTTGISDRMDFLSMISHELGHALGMGNDVDFLYEDLFDNDPPFDDTGIADSRNDGTLWVFDFNTGGVEALLTDNGFGQGDTDTPFHTAASHVNNVVQTNGKFYFASDDIMNPGLPNGQRRLPSRLAARVLAEVYPYTLVAPERHGSFYAHLDGQGELLLRGGSTGLTNGTDPMYPDFSPELTSNSNELFTLEREGDDLEAHVFIGLPIPGTASDATLTHVFPFEDIDTITLKPTDGRNDPDPSDMMVQGEDDGDDIVALDFKNGNILPPNGLTADGGTGFDILVIRNLPAGTELNQDEQFIELVGLGTIEFHNFERLIVDFDGGVNTANFRRFQPEVESLRVDGGADNDFISLRLTSDDLADVTVNGRAGNDTVEVLRLTSATTLVVNGEDGDDLLHAGGTRQDMDRIFGEVIYDGGNGNDNLLLNDVAHQISVDYVFDTLSLQEGLFQRNSINYRFQNLENVLLLGSTRNDEILVSATLPGVPYVLESGPGDDHFTFDSNGLANGGTVNNLRGEVWVNGQEGTDTLTLVDSSDTADNVLTITNTSIGDGPEDNFFDPGGGHIDYVGLEVIDVYFGSGGDRLNSREVTSGIDLSYYGARGNDIFSVGTPVQGNPFDVEKGWQGTVGANQARIYIDGGTGENRLQVNDAATLAGKIATITDATIGDGTSDNLFGPGGQLQYRDIFLLELLLGEGHDQAFVESTHEGTQTTRVNGGPGEDRVHVESPQGNANQIRNLLHVQGADDDDRLTIIDTTDPQANQVTITDTTVGAASGDDFFFGDSYVSYEDLRYLTVQAGQGDDTLRVESTAAATETSALGGDGLDQILLGQAGLVDQLRSMIVVDGQQGEMDRLQIDNTADLSTDRLTLTNKQIGGAFDDTYFPAGGAVAYAGLSDILIGTSQDDDVVQVESTAIKTQTIVSTLDGNDLLNVDSNGPLIGGSAEGVEGSLVFFGGNGQNKVFVDDSGDLTGDQLTIEPLSPNTGRVGRGPGDTFFGGGWLTYISTNTLAINTSATAADQVFVAPAPAPTGTEFEIFTSGPSGADPQQVDVVELDLSGSADPLLSAFVLGAVEVTTSTHASMRLAGVEMVKEASGTALDVVVDMNLAALGGNNGAADRTDVQQRRLLGQPTVEVLTHGVPLVGVHESSLRSLSVLGSTDDNHLVITETADGLPKFAAQAPLAQVNAAFQANAHQPSHVGLYYSGGGGSVDELTVQTIGPQALAKYDDTLGASKSGNVNVEGQFSLWYEQLSPVTFNGAGGSLKVDASLLTNMTKMNHAQLADGSFQVTGDGGFETTTYRGLPPATLVPPAGVVPRYATTVNSTGDGGDTLPGDGRCISSDGDGCTLRAAIEEWNGSSESKGSIWFDVPGDGPHLIQPGSPLPDIKIPLVIDGYSQPGAEENQQAKGGLKPKIMVQLDGSQLPGEASGLVIAAGFSTIRGLSITNFGDATDRSKPSGGIVVLGPGRSKVEGNFVGVAPDGVTAAGNRGQGIYVGSAKNTIGGLTAASRNLISANVGDGIRLQGSAAYRNAVLGNLIGTAANGSSALGNHESGVLLNEAARGNTIGQIDPRAENTIAYNDHGVVVLPGSAENLQSEGNSVRGNSIHSNQHLGIDLVATGREAADGPTANDRLDRDRGGNNLQNYPILSRAQAGQQLLVQGTLDSHPDAAFVIDFYANRQPDESGFGEGEKYLGSLDVQTDRRGRAMFQAELPVRITKSIWISATATLQQGRLGGESSEFSPAIRTTSGFQRMMAPSGGHSSPAATPIAIDGTLPDGPSDTRPVSESGGFATDTIGVAPEALDQLFTLGGFRARSDHGNVAAQIALEDLLDDLAK